MKIIKKTAEYTIYQRKDERYAVQGPKRTWINGDEKVAILVKESLRKAPEKKAEPEPEAVEEAPAEEGGEE